MIGTPAEEGGGGKVKLLRAGVFEGVDCAMMIHGFDRTILHQDLLGIVRTDFEYAGKAAHASADPWAGVNALDACIQTFNAVSMLRQQVRPDCRIHGIIANGGAAANIIPEYAEGDVLRPGAADRHDVGAPPSRARLRRGRGPRHGRDADGRPSTRWSTSR